MSEQDATLEPKAKKVSKADRLEEISIQEKELDLEIKQANVEKLKADKERKTRINAQRASSLSEFNFQQREEKRRCNHLKGGIDGDGKLGTGDGKPSVFLFRYPMGERVAHCSRCQAEWHPGDKAEYLVRFGRKVKNPTGMGYEHALVMAAKSNNREGSSIQFTITKLEQVPGQLEGEQFPDE